MQARATRSTRSICFGRTLGQVLTCSIALGLAVQACGGDDDVPVGPGGTAGMGGRGGTSGFGGSAGKGGSSTGTSGTAGAITDGGGKGGAPGTGGAGGMAGTGKGGAGGGAGKGGGAGASGAGAGGAGKGGAAGVDSGGAGGTSGGDGSSGDVVSPDVSAPDAAADAESGVPGADVATDTTDDGTNADAGDAGFECQTYCTCMEATCALLAGYPFTEAGSCMSACGGYTSLEQSCWLGYCNLAKTSDTAHNCAHAWGELQTMDCPPPDSGVPD